MAYILILIHRFWQQKTAVYEIEMVFLSINALNLDLSLVVCLIFVYTNLFIHCVK